MLASAAHGAADVCIVGGGIVGTVVARALLLRFPRLKLHVVEKEAALATHQSHRNSGVIHAGMYYTPGSDRARMCVEGAARMYEYCEAKGLPHARIGKLIVATTPDEVTLLHSLFERGNTNGVPGLELVGRDRMREIEPLVEGLEAIWYGLCIGACKSVCNVEGGGGLA